MFDISWGKLVIIGVVALLVIGPKDLPMVLRTVGQWMTKIRRMASEFQGQFQEAMREAEMTDLKKQFDDTTSAVKSAFDTTDIKKEMEKLIGDPAGVTTPPATPASSDPATPPSDPAAPAPTDPVALGTAPVAPVEIAVPMPELPPPPTSKDFAEAAPAPAAAPAPTATPAPTAAPAPARPSEPVPEAGGGKAA
jgi:sec-independent protein translocase protein TatB